MKIKSGILFFIGMLNVCLVLAQSEINYKHNTLVKALQKAGVTDMLAVEEISFSNKGTSAKQISGKYFLINDKKVSQYQYIYVGRVNSCRTGGCSISNDLQKDGTSEYFDYYILFDKHKTVRAVKVFNYQATHGHEITSKGWLNQFIGYNGSKPLQVNKNIDAISGATISVYAITIDVEMKTEVLNNFL